MRLKKETKTTKVIWPTGISGLAGTQLSHEKAVEKYSVECGKKVF